MSARPRRHRTRGGGRKPAASVPKGQVTLTIQSLGSQGDGVGWLEQHPVYVPLTVPGDRVVVSLLARRGEGFAARLEQIVEPGVGRKAPFCAHFARCGGCSMQHVEASLYQSWKRQLVVDALAHQGLTENVVEPLRSVHPAQRRRVSWAVQQTAAGPVVGFNAHHSTQIVALDQCPLLSPALNQLLAILPGRLDAVLAAGVRAQVAVNEVSNGLDVVIRAEPELTLARRQALADFAEQADLARLSWSSGTQGEGEPLANRRTPLVHFDQIAVALPAGAFLQPSVAGESQLRGLVHEALNGVTRSADLYAGCGSFALPLARHAHVLAVEGETTMTTALSQAAGQAGLGGRLSVQCRDLVRQPLLPTELEDFEGVVLDPPRAGAREQCQHLAASQVPVVVMVSCNAATFARDARSLCQGGYALKQVVPVDQFPETAHLEMVGIFQR